MPAGAGKISIWRSDLPRKPGLSSSWETSFPAAAELCPVTGNMPASTDGYAYPALQKIYPADLLQLFQDSVNAAAPRTVTPYWSDVSSSIQATWHPPANVDPDTPQSSETFIEEILKGGKLL